MKKLLNSLLFPPLLPSIFFFLCSVWGLISIFLHKKEDALYAYPLYVLSAWSFTVLCIRLVQLFLRTRRTLLKNERVHSYFADTERKEQDSLTLSFAVDLIYSLYKAVFALQFQSSWFGASAFYYMVLGAEHFLLLRHSRQKKDLSSAWKSYRFCGYSLLLLTVAILSIHFHNIVRGDSVHYPGHLIYAAAAYTFYSLVTAIIKLARYRNSPNPVHAAGKLLKLASALVALFSLQIAMIETFGDGSPWQQIMNMMTSTTVCLLIIGMSIHMIRKGSKQLNSTN